MTWSEFKAAVDELLTIERRRLGVQPFIDRQVRLAVGDVQRLIDYYRTGIVTTLEHDDLTREGFASKGELPKGANLRELYHVRTGNPSARRPLYEINLSNRHEMVAGVVGAGRNGGFFRYCIDHRDGGRDLYVYPAVTSGYSVQIVWDAVVGRSSSAEFADTDIVPFDEPVVSLVHQYVKREMAREVERDIPLSREYERTYRTGIASLHSEVQERLRLKRAQSEADYGSSCADGGSIIALQNVIPSTCCVDPSILTTSGCQKPDPKPATEWVMFGDSGEYATIQNTVSVATAVKAVNPDFIIHMGDAAYPANGALGGDPSLLRDMFVKHYWNFIRDGKMYFSFGNHDLDYNYGSAFFDALPNLASLVGDKRSQNKYWYEFVQGPVRFFVLNSGIDDSDANINFVEQRTWLAQRVCAATEKWIIAIYHRPQYTSDASHHPGSTLMRSLNLHELGFDLVVNAHAHNYERIIDSHGLMHVICGLGGAIKRGKATSNLPSGSEFFYSEKYGFLRFTASEDIIQFDMVTVDNEVIDRISIEKLEPRSVDCTTYGYA